MKELTSYVYEFEELIRGNFLYIDKTEYVWKLLQPSRAGYFLSRPRRFGKSLLVSTLKAAFEGRRELFKGLALYDKPYDWKPYPVVHLDLGDCSIHNEPDLREYLVLKLRDVARKHGLDDAMIKPSLLASSFSMLIERLSLSQSSPVAILIDEYDKPILENITRQEEIAAIRDTLADFYSPLKTQQEHERFVMLTGVSKFCHVSIFSKLNNLTDITMDARFATMLGYTQEEFEANFAEHLARTEARQTLPHGEYLAEIKRWYDGFRFEEDSESVYNPVSLANFFLSGGKFNNYWFSTGTPTFLIELIKRKKFDFEKALGEPVGSLAFSAYEVDNLEVLPLLLQTGYLTIRSSRRGITGTVYRLDFPNLEVKSAFDCYLLNAYTKLEQVKVENIASLLIQHMQDGNVDGLRECLTGMIAAIPYDLFIREERYFQTIVFLVFLLLGAYIDAEAHTNTGRIDAVAACGDWIYIFEFKIDQDEEVAFDQIMARQYYQKYQNRGRKIVLIGANFSYDKRQLDGWKSRRL